jgi:hypothetical protein
VRSTAVIDLRMVFAYLFSRRIKGDVMYGLQKLSVTNGSRRLHHDCARLLYHHLCLLGVDPIKLGIDFRAFSFGSLATIIVYWHQQ